MTARERAALRDIVARKRQEKTLADEAAAEAIDADLLRKDAGRAALAAYHEAISRAAGHKPVPPPSTIIAPVCEVRSRDETKRLLAQLRTESDVAARVVDALPPVELCAHGFDPVDHARGILDALTVVAA